jgi:ATPase subunit of ABC transporter with duplicated ATPase domains
MGRNGAGKTTLLKMIAGASAPDAGSVRLGASLYMGYFAQQSLDVLHSDLTVLAKTAKEHAVMRYKDHGAVTTN